MTEVISLHDLPHRRAVALLRTGVPVFVPVDPVEYHGPHLSLHNDHWIATGIAKDVHARLVERHPDGKDWPFVLSANLELGVEPTAGPGTRPAGYRRVKPLVVEAAHALADLGAQRVIFMTFHGVPLHSRAIQAGVKALMKRGITACSPMNTPFRDQIVIRPEDMPEIVLRAIDTVKESERAELRRTLGWDFHAGFMETSLSLHYAPHTVDDCYLELPDCPPVVPEPAIESLARGAAALGNVVLARELSFGALGIGWSKLHPFPGYTGKPRLANREAGAHFARYVADRATEVVLDVLAGGAPPEPVMQWVHATSLGGLLPGADAAQRQGSPS